MGNVLCNLFGHDYEEKVEDSFAGVNKEIICSRCGDKKVTKK